MAKVSKKPGPATSAPVAPPDPLGPEQLKMLATRLGIPLLAVWLLGGGVAAVTRSETVRWSALAVAAALTVAALVFLLWMLRRARAAQGVFGIVAGVETKADREAAIGKLEEKFKPGDTTATFAKAQLLMQDDPRKALEVLETIDLSKAMSTVADEARGQRAMIHLALGEVAAARDLVDGIELSRHQDARSRAMLVAVIGEAWARSGQAKRAVSTLSIIDDKDPELEQLRPQLLRAQAYAAAHSGDLARAKRALKRLCGQDARLLGGFMDRRAHPILQREARRLLEQAGALPRKVQYQRR